jgi:hypothetical protein
MLDDVAWDSLPGDTTGARHDAVSRRQAPPNLSRPHEDHERMTVATMQYPPFIS